MKASALSRKMSPVKRRRWIASCRRTPSIRSMFASIRPLARVSKSIGKTVIPVIGHSNGFAMPARVRPVSKNARIQGESRVRRSHNHLRHCRCSKRRCVPKKCARWGAMPSASIGMTAIPAAFIPGIIFAPCASARHAKRIPARDTPEVKARRQRRRHAALFCDWKV